MTRITTLAAIFSLWAGIALAQEAPKVPQPDSHSHDATAGMQTGKPAVRSAALTLTFGDKTATLTPEAFAALAHVSLTAFNEHAKTNQTYSGYR